ncbi:MAG: ornithine aminomutase subunit alpha [Candidatus Izemoplasmataceae bacterium]
MKERQDDYLNRSKHLKNMNDSELKNYFYELAEKIVNPLLELSYTHTTKSIERSVLLRMGLSSIDSKAVVDKLNELNLLRKGAGHCVYKLMKEKSMDLQQATNSIINENGADYILEMFKK